MKTHRTCDFCGKELTQQELKQAYKKNNKVCFKCDKLLDKIIHEAKKCSK